MLRVVLTLLLSLGLAIQFPTGASIVAGSTSTMNHAEAKGAIKSSDNPAHEHRTRKAMADSSSKPCNDHPATPSDPDDGNHDCGPACDCASACVSSCVLGQVATYSATSALTLLLGDALQLKRLHVLASARQYRIYHPPRIS